VLRAAIDRLTFALTTASDDVIGELVTERRALREELREKRETSADHAAVIDLADARKRRG
jgi:hypothetical protein